MTHRDFHTYSGQCQCGLVKLSIELPEPLENLSPRQCDCDFCMARDIRYLSHPKGVITIGSDSGLTRQQQGSNQADFVTCNQCEMVVAVCCRFEQQSKGAINTQVLDNKEQLQTAIVASPKLLAAEDKYQRWQQLWATLEGLT